MVICRDVGTFWSSQSWECKEMDGVFLQTSTCLPWKRLFLEALHPRGCLFLARGQHFVGPVSHVPRGAMKLVAGWRSGTRCCLGLDSLGRVSEGTMLPPTILR